MQKLSNKDKIILVGIIVLFVLYGYYALLLNPLMSKISNVNSEITTANEKVAEIQDAKVKNAQYEKQINDLKTKYEDAVKSVPENLRDPEIALDINTLAQKANVNLNTLNFAKATELGNSAQGIKNTEKVYTSGISISIDGSYQNVMKFVKSLEDDSRLTYVNSTTLSSNQKSGNSGVTASISTSYFYKGITDSSVKYDFNNSNNYGKDDLFK